MDYENYLSTHFGRIASASESRHRLDSLRANYNRLLPRDRSAKVLEIGPGRGEFLELAVTEMGYTAVSSIDLSAEVVVKLSQRFPNVMHVANPTRFLTENKAAFDSVCMMHVLEHVPKPEVISFVDAIRQSLAPGGTLIIEVPNMANPFVGLTFRYADFTHETGFTRTSLEQILRMGGFEDIEIRAFRIPGGSFGRFVQRVARFLVEGAASLIGVLYFGRREIVSPNIIAVARTAAPMQNP